MLAQNMDGIAVEWSKTDNFADVVKPEIIGFIYAPNSWCVSKDHTVVCNKQMKSAKRKRRKERLTKPGTKCGALVGRA